VNAGTTEARWTAWLSPCALAVAALAMLASGCASPAPLAATEQIEPVFHGDTVSWTTTGWTLGAVRFGHRPSAYDAVAYPAAAQRADRDYARDHRVVLFSAAPGETLYLQALAQDDHGTTSASVESRLVIGSQPLHGPLLTWTMIDVGFGDSHLLTMPTTNRRVLIDAGERRDCPNVNAFLSDSGIHRLDDVIPTHIHEDHIGGLVGSSGDPNDGVLGAYEIGEVLDAPTHSGSRSAYDELLAILTARSIPRRIIAYGETDAGNPALAWDPEVHVEVLNAGGGHSIGGATEDDWINNDSIVLRVTYGEVSFILGGDAESPVQSHMVALHAPLESEVLKVHHHGHIDSTDPVYLGQVAPRVGLIPIATYESYSGTLPSATVLERLRQQHVDVYASDRAVPLGLAINGSGGIHVTVVTDGRSYEVHIAPSRTRHYPGSYVAGSAQGGGS
jgi:beta-lactamase superfamily II metal-dependent hydrolase